MKNKAFLAIFQFHKGTIKTRALERRERFSLRFQFHKGTIKTTDQLADLLADLYFNSIKVRLKQFWKLLFKQIRLISIP